MKLEAKDRKYPTLSCVASIKEVNKNNGNLLIHFDGWESTYNYWCTPDSTDIHPVGWCDGNDKKLQPPKGMRNLATISEITIIIIIIIVKITLVHLSGRNI